MSAEDLKMKKGPEPEPPLPTKDSTEDVPLPSDGKDKKPDLIQLMGDQNEANTIIEMLNQKFNLKPKKPEPKEHTFWNTQPVPPLAPPGSKAVAVTEEPEIIDGPIDAEKTIDDIRETPYNLPAGYEWVDMDMTDDKVANDAYTLLTENYVEDDDNMFRFDYSVNFLRWALLPPGYVKEWHVGIRVSKTQKLVGFITGIPAEVTVNHQPTPTKMAEINFLCVHKKLRSKRLAPVLIKEVTRRVNRLGQWQAVYTAGVVIPTPITSCRYWHRSLNPKKLIDVKFSRLSKHMTLKTTIRFYQLPDVPAIKGIRQMEKKDVKQVTTLLTSYLKQFKLYSNFHEPEVEHWFMPRPGVIDTYVVEDPESRKITDFLSFYHLPSTVIGHDKYNKLNACYSFYNVCTKNDMRSILSDALIFAKKNDCDVFNALDVMENEPHFKELKFGIGDGHLQYYLYNWQTKHMAPKDVGLVLM